MKIALVGEMSGLYKNLRIGLESYGHIVDIYADEDGWKKITGANFPLSNKKGNSIISKIYGYIFWPIYITSKIKNYDVVQVISPHLFMDCLNTVLVRKIIKNNKQVFVSMAGECFTLEEIYQHGAFRYYIYDNEPSSFLKKNLFWNSKSELKLMKLFKGIIPISYEYAIACKKYKNLCNAVQIPIDYKAITYHQNIVNDKIVIFHGLNRENVKGTSFIRRAMEKISQKYPNKVKCIITGRLPLEKYLEIMQQTNIIIDQCKTYSWGLNALYGLAEGKVVLGGGEPEAKSFFNVPDNPIINILPDENDIFMKLEYLILNQDYISTLGEKGRKYIEKYHNPLLIAAQYLDIWGIKNH